MDGVVCIHAERRLSYWYHVLRHARGCLLWPLIALVHNGSYGVNEKVQDSERTPRPQQKEAVEVFSSYSL